MPDFRFRKPSAANGVAKLRSFFNLPKEIFTFFPFFPLQYFTELIPFLAAAKVNTVFNFPRNIQSFLNFFYPPFYLHNTFFELSLLLININAFLFSGCKDRDTFLLSKSNSTLFENNFNHSIFISENQNVTGNIQC